MGYCDRRMSPARCPSCNNKLLQKSGGTVRIRIQGALEVTEAGLCKALCYWCKAPVVVPLQLVKGGLVDEEQFLLREPPVAR